MPYKDPERKRQWEREHREERNARRRKSIPNRASSLALDTPILNPTTDKKSSIRVEGILSLVIGFTFAFIILFAIRYSRSNK
jgi:hypothetical protein